MTGDDRAGPEIALSRPTAAHSRPLRVALAGCGVVGGGVLPRLLAGPRFEVVGVLVRDPASHATWRFRPNWPFPTPPPC